MDKREALDKLHRIDFYIGETVTNRQGDCLANKLNIEDFTDNENLFFTDNWLPVLLKDIPGKYVWIGFPYGRGHTVKRYLPEMRVVARKLAPNAEVYDFTKTTSMLFVFIPDEL